MSISFPNWNRELSGDELARAWLEGEWRRAGGREAYEAAQRERQEARDAMPKVPDLKVVLARFWADYNGEKWSMLGEVEQEVRLAEMDRQIRTAANTHHH